MYSIKSFIFVLKEKFFILLCLAGIIATLPYVTSVPLFEVTSTMQFKNAEIDSSKNSNTEFIETKSDLKYFLLQDEIKKRTENVLPNNSFEIKEVASPSKSFAKIVISSKKPEIAVLASDIFVSSAIKSFNLKQNRTNSDYINKIKENLNKLNAKEKSIKDTIRVKKQNNIYSAIEEKTLQLKKLKEKLINLNEQITENTKILEKKSKIKAYFQKLDDTKEKKERIQNLLTKIDSLAETYGSKHPKMTALIKRVNLLKRQYQKYYSNFVENFKAEHKEIIKEKEEISIALEEINNFLNKYSALPIKIKELENEISTINKDKQALSESLLEISISPKINSIFAKKISTTKRVIKKDLNLFETAKIFLLTLLSGITFVLFFTLRKPSLLNKSFASNYLEISNVVEIPNLNFNYSDNSNTGLIENQEISQVAVISSNDKGNLPQLSLKKKSSNKIVTEAKEAFRYIRTSAIVQSNNKVILITSSNKREGKTTIAINLAMSFSKAGYKTLLLKSDLREDSENKSTVFGLTDYLCDQCNLKESLNESGAENLWITPRGLVSTDCSDLISSKKFEAYLNSVKELFDHIIIDGSECLTKSDSLFIASLSDSTIVISDKNETNRSDVKEAIKRLKTFNASIAGVMLNEPSYTKKVKTKHVKTKHAA